MARLKNLAEKKGGKMKFRCMSEKPWQEHRGEQWVEQQGDKEHDQEKEHPASVLKARRHFLSTWVHRMSLALFVGVQCVCVCVCKSPCIFYETWQSI